MKQKYLVAKSVDWLNGDQKTGEEKTFNAHLGSIRVSLLRGHGEHQTVRISQVESLRR